MRGRWGLVLVAAALAGTPHGAFGGSRRTLERIETTYYDASFLRRADTYHRFRLAVVLVETAAVLAAAGWLAAGPLGGIGRRALQATGGHPWAARALVLTGLHAGFSLLALPFSAVLFAEAREFGQRHDAWGSFLLDWAKGIGVGWVVVLAVGLTVLGLFAAFPRTWWLWATLAVGVLSTLYVYAAPLVIDPLFNRFHRMEDPVLEARLLELAHRGGVDADRVMVADASRRTGAANAYVTGVGKSRRIVVYDTLLAKFTPDEIASVLAHEIGHWRRHHIRTGLILGTAGALLGFLAGGALLGGAVARGTGGLAGRGDPGVAIAAYALFLFLSTAASVPANWVSRKFEAQADHEALVLTRDPEAFIGSEVRLARENLSQVLPPAWVEFVFYTHPCNARRIEMAESFR
jgi:STE24 endopeptidase